MLVDVDMRKWGGHAHWRFKAELLGRDDYGTWLGGAPPVPYTGPRGPGEFLHPFVSVFPEGAWWVASFNDEQSNICVYVDITTPVEWLSEDHLTVVDLDLDVARFHDGRVELLDEDEFAEHRIRYAYPDDVCARALESAEALFDAVRQQREPFGDVGLRWLTELRSGAK